MNTLTFIMASIIAVVAATVVAIELGTSIAYSFNWIHKKKDIDALAELLKYSIPFASYSALYFEIDDDSPSFVSPTGTSKIFPYYITSDYFPRHCKILRYSKAYKLVIEALNKK